MSVPNPFDVFTSGMASICRFPGGVTVAKETEQLGPGPDQKLPRLKQLYDVENNRACRVVRERITEYDLNIDLVIPSAVNSRVFAEEDYEFSLEPGAILPRLVVEDATGERTLSGGDQIVSFLDQTFGRAVKKEDLKEQAIAVLREIGGYAADLFRMGRGVNVSPAAGEALPKKPLILYSYEGNQFCRLVREVLTELDIVYELRSAGKGSPRRTELASLTGGSSQCPYLVDPNTGASMAESADIVRYLYKTYAKWTPPNELLQWASDVILPAVKPLFSLLTPIQAGSNRSDKDSYDEEMSKALLRIEDEVNSEPVVVYTYGLSPFSTSTKALLEDQGIDYKEISLGLEWFPGLIKEGGSIRRAALLEMTGQSSLPHVFIGGKSIGGLFSGNPGLVPALEQGILKDMVSKAQKEGASRASVQAGTFE